MRIRLTMDFRWLKWIVNWIFFLNSCVYAYEFCHPCPYIVVQWGIWYPFLLVHQLIIIMNIITMRIINNCWNYYYPQHRICILSCGSKTVIKLHVGRQAVWILAKALAAMAKIVLTTKCQESDRCGSVTLRHFRGPYHGSVVIMSGADEIYGHQSLGDFSF